MSAAPVRPPRLTPLSKGLQHCWLTATSAPCWLNHTSLVATSTVSVVLSFRASAPTGAFAAEPRKKSVRLAHLYYAAIPQLGFSDLSLLMADAMVSGLVPSSIALRIA